MKSGLVVVFALSLGGCVHTAATIVTAPVRVGAKAVRVVAPTQSQRDRSHGRKLRKAEARARHECRGAGDRNAQRDCVGAKLKAQGIF